MNLKATPILKCLILIFTLASCLLASGFLKSNWDSYQARKKLNNIKILVSKGQNARKEISALGKSLPKLEKDPWSLNKFGDILSGQGKIQDAIRVYEMAQKAACSPSTLATLAALYLETGQFDKSISSARQALDILPWKLTPRFTLASAQLKKGNKKEAFTYCLDTILTPEKRRTRNGMKLKQQARELLPLCIPEESRLTNSLESIISGIENPETQQKLKLSLLISGGNRTELEKALLTLQGEKLDALIFLLVNMPESDLRKLDSSYLLENIDLAYEVLNIWPFMPDIPEDIFMNYLLPYAQLEEKRDNWRKEFLILCTPMVNECKSAGEVVLSLQSWLPLQLLFTFDHEGRSRSNWSVGEIIENRTANCIGLSILLADACRAVGIPARIATIPKWKDVPGGHTWVEIWDQGEWRHISAFDPSPVNRTWMEERTADTDTTKFNHRIYGASFKRTAIQVKRYGPNVWWQDSTSNYVKESGGIKP